MIRLSIIIPVYNVQNYLIECVNSIIIQKVKDVEIILIDDGSTDESGKICDEMSRKHKNITVLHQKNGGLSSARNAGIRIAKGEYLMFVDSDDFISCKEDLNDLILNLKYDIVQYKMIYYYDKINKYVYLKDMNINNDIEYQDKLKRKVELGTLSVSACDKIVRRSLVIDNNLYFKDGLLSEDIDWSLGLYLKAKSLKEINKNLYVYRQQRKGSITSKLKENNIVSLYNIITKWYNYEYENDKQRVIYMNYLAYQYAILICGINKFNCSKKLKKEIFAMKSILDYNSNYKVKIVKKVLDIMGINLGRYIMKLYLVLKNKGIVKI